MAQWNRNDLDYRLDGTTLYETVMQADRYGLIHDPAGVTSKNRLQVSTYETAFFNTFQYGKETDVWDEFTANGGAAAHNPTTNNVDMTVDGTLGSIVVRQTRNVQRYIPGRQSTLAYAVRMETPVVGIRRRFGLFDEGDGFYFEDAGVINVGSGLPEYNVVIRSSTSGSVVETRVPRSQWNADKLDGNGPSKITADPVNQQLINFEYEWYGAGQVKIGFAIDGRTHTIHTFNHANILNLPWCATPFLPIRLEIENVTGAAGTAGTHYLYQGSNSLISEGTPDKLGIAQNVTAPIIGTTLTGANKWYPVLSIRLQPDQLKGIVLPRFFQTATIDNTNIFYRLVRNPVIPPEVALDANGPQPWLDMKDPNAFTQYQTYITPAEILEANQGSALDSGFVVSGGGGSVELDDATVYQLGRTGLGTVSDTYTILCASNGTNKSALAAMTWIEQR